MYQGRTFCQNCGLGEVNPLSRDILDATMGTVYGKKEIREAASFLRTVSLQWFPEQPNLKDEIFLRGGRFVTSWISEFYFSKNFSDLFLDLPLDLILNTSLELKLEHIFFPCSSGP